MMTQDQSRKVRKIMQTVNTWIKEGMQDPPPKKVKLKETENGIRIIIKIPKPTAATDTTTDAPPEDITTDILPED